MLQWYIVHSTCYMLYTYTLPCSENVHFVMYVLLLFSFCLRGNDEKSNSFDVLFFFGNAIITAGLAIGFSDELVFFSFHFIFFAFVIPLFPFPFCIFVFLTLIFMENSLLSSSFIIFAVVIFLFSKKIFVFLGVCMICIWVSKRALKMAKIQVNDAVISYQKA